jgi:Flp pilus assembly protein TadB
MSFITREAQSKQLERAEARSQIEEASMNHNGGHSMKWHVLLCVLGMIAGIAGVAVLGVNVAALFCVAMMVSMVWMVIAPAAGKLRQRDHGTH